MLTGLVRASQSSSANKLSGSRRIGGGGVEGTNAIPVFFTRRRGGWLRGETANSLSRTCPMESVRRGKCIRLAVSLLAAPLRDRKGSSNKILRYRESYMCLPNAIKKAPGAEARWALAEREGFTVLIHIIDYQ